MDELVIGEKKYISSKQAAKITGYAKDYIGQLCREGRVPARLVGRSWYVLESAIQDHRFGEAIAPTDNEQPVATGPIGATWEAPRYEAVNVEQLPETASSSEKGSEAARGDSNDPHSNFHDSWKAWFDNVKTAPSEDRQIPDVEPEAAEQEEAHSAAKDASEGTTVPIRAINMPAYHPLPEELQPRRNRVQKADAEIQLPTSEERVTSNGSKKFLLAVNIFGGLIALSAGMLATLSSGALDQYLIGHNRIESLAGITVLRK